MLKVLIKKQLMEIFRSYLYDAKNGKKRSTAGVIGYFIMFAAIIIGVIGGMFTALSIMLCEGLVTMGMDWLYFLIMGGIALVFGVFGSVFNTFSSLYLAKDNDLLLSMPIPVRYLLISRLSGVFLMGLMYSGVAIIPAVIVYWITAPVTALTVLGGMALILVIAFIAFCLSCILGYVVARISLKLKNQKMIVTLISVICIGAYYYFYMKAQVLVRELVANAVIYGEKITGNLSGRGLRLFGLIGAGDPAAILTFVLGTAFVTAIALFLLERSFLKVATSANSVKKSAYKEKQAHGRSVFRALLGKEFRRFGSSPNYMLNSGLGTVMIPAAAVALLLKGDAFLASFNGAFAERPGGTAAILLGIILMLASTNDIAAPSVSLEGKSLWLSQALPVKPQQILYAKLLLQFVLTAVPVLFASVCAVIVVEPEPLQGALMILVPLFFELSIAGGALSLGILMPNLNWTNEIYVVKQSACVAIALFGGWALSAAEIGPFFLLNIGLTPYLLFLLGVNIGLSVFEFRWLSTKGADRFMKL